MGKKIYAVKKGKKTGIFYDWNICKQQIDGYSGAEYKSFTSEAEAKDYLYNNDNYNFTNINTKSAKAYVDGSYDEANDVFSYGVVIFDGSQIIKHGQSFKDESLLAMRNVAGEIKGAAFAMQYCIRNKIDELYLYYDYAGIKNWCTGEWKAKKEGTKKYKNYYDSIKLLLNVNFIKVKAHSGNEFNDMADSLAREAINKSNDNKFEISNEAKIFYKIMSQKSKSKSNFSVIYKNTEITQLKMKKYATKLFENIGNNKENIYKINFTIDIQNNA